MFYVFIQGDDGRERGCGGGWVRINLWGMWVEVGAWWWELDRRTLRLSGGS